MRMVFEVGDDVTLHSLLYENDHVILQKRGQGYDEKLEGGN